MRNGLIIDSDGTQRWYLDGQLHRENGPAIIWEIGDLEWYHRGIRHRDNGPAIIADDYQSWWHQGKYHRENGPAIIRAYGTQSWCINDNRIDVEEWIKQNKLLSWETWDDVTWSLFRLEFL